jgi:hypothetical protein
MSPRSHLSPAARGLRILYACGILASVIGAALTLTGAVRKGPALGVLAGGIALIVSGVLIWLWYRRHPDQYQQRA